MTSKKKAEGKQTQRALVRDGYSRIARSGGSCCSSCGCGGQTSAAESARKSGYADQEITIVPESANMGLSCGNPVSIAQLRPGEIVLDLGCGGGFDVFLAAVQVGKTGRVIGVDMTPAMVEKAEQNALEFRKSTGLNNVEFHLGEIEDLPLPSNSVDVVISNCVINLSPEKMRVWQEIYRVLKPGGRVAIADFGLIKPLPPAVLYDNEALLACVAGAALIADTINWARKAGLVDVTVVSHSIPSGNESLYQKINRLLPPGADIADYLVNTYVQARKPAV